MKKFLFLALLFFLSFSKADEYRLGEGYQIGDTPLYLGGYFSLREDINHGDSEFDLDDVALLLYGSFEKFDFLGEVEASDVTFEKEGKGDFDLLNQELHLERLYLAFALDDDTQIYLGKFNSDIGFWNQTPINVLHDTTTPPHVMSTLFPKLTTGLGYIRELNQDMHLTVAIQHNEDLDEKYNNLYIKRHYSISLKNTKNSYTWGVGGGYFKERSQKISTYATIGLTKEFEKFTLLSELYSRQSEDAPSVPYDIYIQTTWHVKDRHDIILRAESYDDEIEDSSDKVGLIGYTYRPRPSIALKAEYEAHSIDRHSHGVFSFSVIF